ncbi:hypothetical protein [Pseudoxanthomonas sacheonensis]|uniref:hypothetical protein n=1 Tax=Pseudoxanthomonas sacheonensis TaxID=443615 RepID=UPI0013D7C53B|nr:hypothetical protein [Pseudoxanthomonas sacheonensis]KAF1708129.1 hypothetical protein CSC73_09285 [Pseudoxanthomonas sacheonensis]
MACPLDRLPAAAEIAQYATEVRFLRCLHGRSRDAKSLIYKCYPVFLLSFSIAELRTSMKRY